jgi:hypothetical protein
VSVIPLISYLYDFGAHRSKNTAANRWTRRFLCSVLYRRKVGVDFFSELLFELVDPVRLWVGRGFFFFNIGLRRPERFLRENGLYPLFHEELQIKK